MDQNRDRGRHACVGISRDDEGRPPAPGSTIIEVFMLLHPEPCTEWPIRRDRELPSAPQPESIPELVSTHVAQ
jgi:hypothetical protein